MLGLLSPVAWYSIKVGLGLILVHVDLPIKLYPFQCKLVCTAKAPTSPQSINYK